MPRYSTHRGALSVDGRNLQEVGPITVTFTPKDISPKVPIGEKGLLAFARTISGLPMVRNVTTTEDMKVTCMVASEGERELLQAGLKQATLHIRSMGEQREVVGVDMPPLRADYVWQTENDGQPRQGGQ